MGDKILIAVAVAVVSIFFIHIAHEVIRHFRDPYSRKDLPAATIKTIGLLGVVALAIFVASFSSDAYSAGKLVGEVLGIALLAYLAWELLRNVIVRPPRRRN
jgi:hypothetical protein